MRAKLNEKKHFQILALGFEHLRTVQPINNEPKV